MAVIKVRDLAYGRLQAPDLDLEEEFLTAFGMVRAARTPTALYMRGTDPAHHIHVTQKGDPRLIGFAWAVSSEDDLKTVAKFPGASGIESIDEPGGGKRVRLTEPNGYTIEVVHGIASSQPIQVVRQAINSGVEPLNRAGEVIRFAAGPSSVKRIGHAVLGSPKNQETVRWFRETLGLVCSDDVYAGDKDNIIGQFSRIDAGDDYVDHHAFFCMKNERAGLNHFSFEVQDIDDVFIGHEYLERPGQVRAHVGHRPPPARQPGLRLLGRSLGPRARTLGGYRSAERAQRRQSCPGRGRAALAMGHAAAGEVPRSRQPLSGPRGPKPIRPRSSE